MDFSVLVPWCNRNEIKETLAKNCKIFSDYHHEVLVLNCGGGSQHLQNLLRDAEVNNVRQIDILAAQFNKCLALNLGAFLSQSDTILVLDADIILDCDLFGIAMPLLQQSAFVALKTVHESHSHYKSHGKSSPKSLLRLERVFTIDFCCTDGSRIHLETHRESLLDGMRSAPGIVVVRRCHLLQVDGYNSDLERWGWEDNDLQLRLIRLGLRRFELGFGIHLSHGDEKRSLQGQNKFTSHFSNLSLICTRYSKGHFCGTYTRDVNDWTKLIRELSP